MLFTHLSQSRGAALSWLAAVLLVLSATAIPVQAQIFSSGSDGSDGALVLTDPGEVVFDPASFDPPLDPDGDNVFHFTSVHIGPGVIVRLTAAKVRSQPVFWLASGAVVIDGTVDLSGGDGHLTNSLVLADRFPSVPGPGGFPGGVGESSNGSPAQPGSGPGGGGLVDANNNHGGAGAGHATRGTSSPGRDNGGQSYGNSFVVPLIGGSGGGGGTFEGTSHRFGGGGGAGGGALLVASSTSISVDGAILANGGVGGRGTFTSSLGNGGCGSGGALHLAAPAVAGTGRLEARGGGGPSDVRSGSVGRIRVDAFQQGFTGSSSPPASFGSPFLVLPEGQPSLRVVSIGGVAVPPDPTGSFEIPDATIMEGGAVPVEIEALRIPLSAEVKLHLVSENAADQVVAAGPLTGTLELSTATATVTVPPGFSRGYVRATWEP